MVDPPRLAPETEAMPGAVYSPFADRIAGRDGPIFPLHVGDTWRDPFVGARARARQLTVGEGAPHGQRQGEECMGVGSRLTWLTMAPSLRWPGGHRGLAARVETKKHLHLIRIQI